MLLNADSPPSPARARIASLVSSSVPNLKPANVTITDASGAMLWPQGDGTDGAGVATKPAAEARYASAMQTSLGALIARTVGTDKAQVQVHADLNVDKATEEQLAYAKKGTRCTRSRRPSLKGTGGSTGGTMARRPPDLRPDAAGGSGTPTASARHHRLRRGQDRHEEATPWRHQPDVALLVDAPVPAAQATR